MRRPHTPTREEAGAIGWVALADAMILALVVVLTLSLLATGALQASRQENARLRNTLAVDPEEYRRTVAERDELRAAFPPL
ncbi:MAG TPA: hypothetical protein VD866_20535, partial [Urbifossiella sp.]|nr:hypothetical protein [Urbifossiella sp.]